MKIYKQSLVFSISALSAALMCQTASVYASDIQIYKSATDIAGSTLMLTLDLSSSMVQGKLPSSSTEQTPFQKDYGVPSTQCKESGTNKYVDENVEYKIDKTTGLITTSSTNFENVSFKGRFCNISSSDTGKSGYKKGIIEKTCKLVGSTYKCPDRLTILKQSLVTLLSSPEESLRLPGNTRLGITVFPSAAAPAKPADVPIEIKRTPTILEYEDQNKKIISNRLAIVKEVVNYNANSSTPIARGYAEAVTGLFNSIPIQNKQCSGYGVYFLTDGEPYRDEASKALTKVSGLLKNTTDITCEAVTGGNWNDNHQDRPKSWRCVRGIAKKLYEKQNEQDLIVKTAVVGFGSEFNFKNSSGDDIPYTKNLTEAQVKDKFKVTVQANDTNTTYQQQIAKQDAALAGYFGGGGWYNADNEDEIIKSLKDFVNDFEKTISATTTGSAVIPQDALNPTSVQGHAYFTQFQPKPTEQFRLWSGNLKKYKVVNSILLDIKDEFVFSDTNGSLNKNLQDLWTNNTTTGSTLGGVLGKLKLKAANNKFNRVIYSNNNAQISGVVDLNYLNGSFVNRKYLLGLLGYDFTQDDLNNMTSIADLASINNKTELRNIGAVLHSTPVMLTQSGKISNNLDTSDRDDYILFGTVQGVLHVVKAGQEGGETADYMGGEEVFAFVPQEILANQPAALLNENTAGKITANAPLYYGIDGQWIAHTEYVYNPTDGKFYTYFTTKENGKDVVKQGKQWVYGGMRMGGRSYYALDLTNISSPSIKFRIDPVTSKVYTSAKKEDGSAITAYSYSHLAKMGQSWSKPIIANVQWQGKRRLVMFVGGGYDPGYETFNYVQDAENNTTNTTTGTGAGIGAGVFMFDANTGEPLWSTYESSTKGDGNNLNYSIVSQIKAIDRDGDGDIDHLYFGDLGGQAFRVDINSTHSAKSTPTDFAQNITRILDLHKNDGLSPRFYESPSFSIYTNGVSKFAVISIGSGNRSTPLLGRKDGNNFIIDNENQKKYNQSMLDDAIYNLFDTDVVMKKMSESRSLKDIQLSDLVEITDTNMILDATESSSDVPANKLSFIGKKGWYYTFKPTPTTIEKAVEKVQGDIVVIANDLYVSTYDASTDMRNTGDCGAGIYGVSNAYRFCMPYGQCSSGQTSADNKLVLGQGILGIAIGAGSDGNAKSRSVIAPIQSRSPATNKILSAIYESDLKLIPLSWYEKN